MAAVPTIQVEDLKSGIVMVINHDNFDSKRHRLVEKIARKDTPDGPEGKDGTKPKGKGTTKDKDK